jgi:transposase
LYVAFELGEKSWKLALGGVAHGPIRYSVAAGETGVVLGCIVKAKARCGLAADVSVLSC